MLADSALSAHLKIEEIEDYVKGNLDVRNNTKVKVHTLNCDPCLGLLLDVHLSNVAEDTARRGVRLEHPTQHEIRAYALEQLSQEDDNRLGDHFLECDQCDRAFRALRSQS